MGKYKSRTLNRLVLHSTWPNKPHPAEVSNGPSLLLVVRVLVFDRFMSDSGSVRTVFPHHPVIHERRDANDLDRTDPELYIAKSCLRYEIRRYLHTLELDPIENLKQAVRVSGRTPILPLQ